MKLILNNIMFKFHDFAKLPVLSSYLDPEDELIALIKQNVQFEMNDVGIGSYEFWGSRGTNRNFVPEVVPSQFAVRIGANTPEEIPEEVSTEVEYKGHYVEVEANLIKIENGVAHYAIQ